MNPPDKELKTVILSDHYILSCGYCHECLKNKARLQGRAEVREEMIEKVDSMIINAPAIEAVLRNLQQAIPYGNRKKEMSGVQGMNWDVKLFIGAFMFDMVVIAVMGYMFWNGIV